MQMTSANGATPLAIEMKGLSKHFGPHRAYWRVSVAPSECYRHK